ncbi:monothiol glutaredoxin, Grx4 family [Xylella fastidiosa subsp. pauca]|uniref:Grx4 family monothiol glutaredoxin n=1 Tax=Xylella fastidiosa TaxID=2371 RepID=UPI000583E1C5|nr:Grx4 family monothiol glutaredoxin [Xylella fastidiosa]ARO68170.1 monothiol glutaredoxin, Grx4 family [Xylella fastidiosa subsp. pauca]AVI20321.1 monothiol glutaredoxin, Grx4 family [Xylella fastidiosa]AVI22330.1 monothiol glutaredoxin, Grx4 family [Xylella fastidiosa]KIA57599.1 glutaredoxin [Xylella fastidiosa]KXB12519.1 glutaredoxin [Xylella fastidiosa]
MSLDSALRSRIETLLHSNRVVLFMKGRPGMPQCGFSAKAAGILQALGVEYAHVNVLDDQEIREGIKRYGDWPTIPQLYIDGELIGGSDIVSQMYENGELSALLGVAAPDLTPPSITITPTAVEMLKSTLANAPGSALALSIDSRFQPTFELTPINTQAIAAESNGLRVQFDLASARRAEGITIDWVDDIRGQGLVIDNPNVPQPIQELSPGDAAAQVGAGALTLVDVRPADERAIASVAVPFRTMDGAERAVLEQLPKETPLAFLCHHGGRSLQAAEHFRNLGFTSIYNIGGGIDAWSTQVDAGVPKY